jgi:hypothetical protein
MRDDMPGGDPQPVLTVLQVIAINLVLAVALLAGTKLAGMSWPHALLSAWIGGAALTFCAALGIVLLAARRSARRIGEATRAEVRRSEIARWEEDAADDAWETAMKARADAIRDGGAVEHTPAAGRGARFARR